MSYHHGNALRTHENLLLHLPQLSSVQSTNSVVALASLEGNIGLILFRTATNNAVAGHLYSKKKNHWRVFLVTCTYKQDHAGTRSIASCHMSIITIGTMNS